MRLRLLLGALVLTASFAAALVTANLITSGDYRMLVLTRSSRNVYHDNGDSVVTYYITRGCTARAVRAPAVLDRHGWIRFPNGEKCYAPSVVLWHVERGGRGIQNAYATLPFPKTARWSWSQAATVAGLHSSTRQTWGRAS